MKTYTLLLFSSLLLACQGSNTTFSWASISLASVISSENGRLGDWVAAGLGLSAHETASSHKTLKDVDEHTSFQSSSAAGVESGSSATTTSNNAQTQMTELSSRNKTQSSTIAISDTANAVGETIPYLDLTANITNVTNCWQSWVSYWSASDSNTGRAAMTGQDPVTKTVTHVSNDHTYIVRSSFVSWYSTYTVTTTSTLSSEGFALSVTTWTGAVTSSEVAWHTFTDTSILSAYYVTETRIASYNKDEIWITLPSTILPTPACTLPDIMPECSSEWSSYIYVNTHSTNAYFQETPDCRQAMITGDGCTSMRSIYMAANRPYELYVPYQQFESDFNPMTRNIGWLRIDNTSYSPASTTLAPGCTLGCQTCSITGDSVQLFYWPPQTLAIGKNGTETATTTHLARNRSSPVTTLVNGTTLTSPTVYISYNILHAADSCTTVGQTYSNLILPLTDTNHLFSMDAVGAGFYGSATLSFNFTDLIEPIPDYIYERQARCVWSSMDYYMGHDGDAVGSFYSTAGNYSCARTAPYAPIIAIPPEVRALDPAWKSCEAWYGGVFDPPKALHPAEAIAEPTLSATTTPIAASPQPTIDSDLATRTSAPAATSLDPQTTHSQNEVDGTHTSSTADPTESLEDPGDNEPDIEQTTKYASNHPSESTEPQSSARLLQEQSSGAAAILSIFLTQLSRSSGIADVSSSKKPASDQHVPDPTYTASAAISGGSASETVSTTTKTEQVAASATGESRHLSNTPTRASSLADLSQGVAVILSMFTAQNDAKPESLQDLLTMSDPASHVENSVDRTIVIPPADSAAQSKYSTLITINEQTYNVDVQSGLPHINGVPASVGETITTNGDVFTISSNMVDFQGSRISLYNGEPELTATTAHDTTALPDHIFSIGDTMYTASAIQVQSEVVLLAGETISKGGAAVTVDGQMITHGQNGISIIKPAGTSPTKSPVSNAKPSVTIDGSTFAATPIPGRSDAVIPQGQTFSTNAEGTTIADRLASKNSNATAVADPASAASSSASGSPSSTEAVESSAVQRNPAGQPEESAARKSKRVFPGLLLWMTIAWMMFECS